MLWPLLPMTCECSVCDTSIFNVTRRLWQFKEISAFQRTLQAELAVLPSLSSSCFSSCLPLYPPFTSLQPLSLPPSLPFLSLPPIYFCQHASLSLLPFLLPILTPLSLFEMLPPLPAKLNIGSRKFLGISPITWVLSCKVFFQFPHLSLGYSKPRTHCCCSRTHFPYSMSQRNRLHHISQHLPSLSPSCFHPFAVFT